jgi:ribulose-bisphosphate carboxylase large chain
LHSPVRPSLIVTRVKAIYCVHADARSIDARARAIANEQSIEMPLAAVDDDFVHSEIVGRVERINPKSDDLYEVEISLSVQTMGEDAGQLMNMLYGNTSLQDDAVLRDVELPPSLVAFFGGPRHGLESLRARVGAGRRALTCSALKPQGLSGDKLAQLAQRFALGGVDYVPSGSSPWPGPWMRRAPSTARRQSMCPAFPATLTTCALRFGLRPQTACAR